MKIRIKGNTIRFRLTKSEVGCFGENGFLEEKTDFGKTCFGYALKSDDKIYQLSAEFVDGTITLHVPLLFAREWVNSERVGCEGEMETGDGKKLFLLLEKDYKCLDTVAADQSDNYENPLAERRR